MVRLFKGLAALHNAVFSGVQFALENWLLGLLARLTFGSVLALYFWNSALTKVNSRTDESLFDYLTIENGAYIQIAPQKYEEVGGDISQLGIEYDLLVFLGTFAEFLLPALILIGLFTRLASLGMIGFIAVMTWVDVTGHGVALDLAKMFDRIPNDPIVDLRLLWLFPLVYLVIRGPGMISIDRLFSRTK